jgi:hypothetical protein
VGRLPMEYVIRFINITKYIKIYNFYKFNIINISKHRGRGGIIKKFTSILN